MAKSWLELEYGPNAAKKQDKLHAKQSKNRAGGGVPGAGGGPVAAPHGGTRQAVREAVPHRTRPAAQETVPRCGAEVHHAREHKASGAGGRATPCGAEQGPPNNPKTTKNHRAQVRVQALSHRAKSFRQENGQQSGVRSSILPGQDQDVGWRPVHEGEGCKQNPGLNRTKSRGIQNNRR